MGSRMTGAGREKSDASAARVALRRENDVGSGWYSGDSSSFTWLGSSSSTVTCREALGLAVADLSVVVFWVPCFVLNGFENLNLGRSALVETVALEAADRLPGETMLAKMKMKRCKVVTSTMREVDEENLKAALTFIS